MHTHRTAGTPCLPESESEGAFERPKLFSQRLLQSIVSIRMGNSLSQQGEKIQKFALNARNKLNSIQFPVIPLDEDVRYNFSFLFLYSICFPTFFRIP